MEPKAFRIINFLAIVLSITATAGCVLALPVSGFYPAVLILLLISLIPLTSRLYLKEMHYKPKAIRRKTFRILTGINFMVIPVVLWMSFVIAIDHIIPNLHYQC